MSFCFTFFFIFQQLSLYNICIMKFRKPGDDIILTKELAGMRDELTARQIEFAHNLVAQENRKTATECAIMAGYSPKTARQIASQLQSAKEYPKVHAYIRSLQEDLWNKYKISPATHMRRLHEIGLRAENPEGKDIVEFDMKPDLKTALAAEISRGKAAGYYEKKEKVKDKSIDSLSLDEVSEMLSKMKKTVIIEGTPADLEDNGPKTVQSDDQSEQSDQQVP